MSHELSEKATIRISEPGRFGTYFEITLPSGHKEIFPNAGAIMDFKVEIERAITEYMARGY
jgi:hypothetical protein